MKVAKLLEARRVQWRELELLCIAMESGSGRRAPAMVARFASLYRAACADLSLADAYQLPPNTVQYLHQLVGRAHNQLYRSQTFRFTSWVRELVYGVPQRLYNDPYLRIAFCLFWGTFLSSMYLGYHSRTFAEKVMGKEQITGLQEMYAQAPSERVDNQNSSNRSNNSMAGSGFYLWHNAGIGLQCFASGLLLGVGGLFTIVSNGVTLGTAFGYMATTPERENFFHFVTAHGPFELTGVVLSAAAGMRMGFAIVRTRGLTRGQSLRNAAIEAFPIASCAVVLFGAAGLIEACVSPSLLPYAAKALISVACSGLLMFYFVMLGMPRGA